MDPHSTDRRPNPNRLIGEKSPYLQQHAYNPVDWYPWGDEAFERARAEDKPVFLSIGYSTCHWCHVMAHESFEDPDVARVLNDHFVSVKVDREERPDIDQIYMTVCQALTRTGGWPLSLFLTPEAKPFFAGTYFPREARMGMPGFMDILIQLARLWEEDRNRLFGIGEEISHALQKLVEVGASGPLPGPEIQEKAFSDLEKLFDGEYGGLGTAPKFPSAHQLTFLLRWHARTGAQTAKEMVRLTLDNMRSGGIFDQIGGGFHRYAVDRQWRVPHFEKMLYDQALLLMAYTEAYLAWGEERDAATAREICTYVSRELTAPEGGFFSAEDADSEGIEGKFYLWKPDEIREHLGEDRGDLFCRVYDIRPEGNFEEGWSIPRMPRRPDAFAREEGMDPGELERLLNECREILFRVRSKRIPPFKDDKILTSWNGLMIAALAKASQALGEPEYAEAGRRAADFLLDRLCTPEGTLWREYRQGPGDTPGFSEDYAFLIWGLLELFETVFDATLLEQALQLQETFLRGFWDENGKGFFFSSAIHLPPLIAPNKEIVDGAVPSANSVAALNLLRLGRLTGDGEYEQKAEEMTRAFSRRLMEIPYAHTQYLQALDFRIGPTWEIVLTGFPGHPDTRRMIATVHRRFLPNKVVLLHAGGEQGKRLRALVPYLDRFPPPEEAPRAYLCRGFTCQDAVTDPEALKSALA